MSIRRDAVQRDFGLRPGSRTVSRPKLSIEPAENAEPSLAETDSSSHLSDDARSSPIQESTPLSPVKDTCDDDGSSTISPTVCTKGLLPVPRNAAPHKRSSDDSQSSKESPEIPPLPAHFPPHPRERPTREEIALWREACLAVQHEDGTVEDFEVVGWIMMRKGGILNSWSRLDEARMAVESMRRDTIDIDAIRRQQEEEAEIARLKEDRRQRNKRRYRPRRQIEKEKAERLAARAAQQVQELAKKPSSIVAPDQGKDSTDIEEHQAKKTKLDTESETGL
ncbi:hypothetical protein FBEOM_5597 [Fusarium beomiforme]|uniref:Uncharacterized protein n=1 Tax=Fusarium beomiforme TaxID=44412 RepID=A0A9P5AKK4_9HYPO|nr:hypothetical protein FBEOM_5597 [Fusarium beomiforme]